MKLVKRDDGWWIEGVPPFEVDGETCTANGPYEIKKDAASDMAGIKRSLERMEQDQNRRAS